MAPTPKTDALRVVLALRGQEPQRREALASLLCARQGYVRIAVADSLHFCVARLFDLDPIEASVVANLTVPQDRFAAFHAQDPDYRGYLVARRREDLYEPRTLQYHMDRFGTDYCRSVGEPLRWVQTAMRCVQAEPRSVVIPDLSNTFDGQEYNALMRAATETNARACVAQLGSGEASTRVDVFVPYSDTVEETYEALVAAVSDFCAL